MFGLSKTTWTLLIVADMLLLLVDIPGLIFGTLSLGLALVAVLVFYLAVGAAAFIVFSLSEFMFGGKPILASVVNGFIAAVLLVIPFPLAPIVAFMFSSESGYRRAYRPYATLLVLAVLLPAVFAQPPMLSPSRLSSWSSFCESVCYRIYEVSVACSGGALRGSALEFCRLRLVSRSNEFATFNVLAVQGTGVDPDDVERSSAALARDLRIASLVVSGLVSTSEGRTAVMNVVMVSSSAVSYAQSVLQVIGASAQVAENMNEASSSALRLVSIASGVGVS